jgi:ankyrin repeat protein
MSKTALIDAVKAFDLEKVRSILGRQPALREFQNEKGFNLLQMCCARLTDGDPAAAARQLRLARWLVAEGFDPLVTHTTKPGEDGEQDPATLSLVFFAVARARNNALARFFLERKAGPKALFAAVWWGNWEILGDLIRHGADVNEIVGATPLHMAVAVLDRGVEGRPERARRRVKTLNVLLRLGADPNRGEFRGNTPLHTALDKGYDVEIVKLLLKHGANPDVPGRDGRTVRQIAARKRDKRYIDAIPPLSPSRLP